MHAGTDVYLAYKHTYSPFHVLIPRSVLSMYDLSALTLVSETHGNTSKWHGPLIRVVTDGRYLGNAEW